MIRTLERTRSNTGTILAQIGNTPLLDLSGFARAQGVVPAVGVFAKAEWANPGGSVKARAALRMVEEAEADGRLTPDKIIVDSSSGNTAIAYALIGSAYWFAYFLVILPILGVIEKPTAQPATIEEDFAAHYGNPAE